MKKIWAIVVEGVSEKHALEGILKTILETDKKILQIVIYGTDILTDEYPVLKLIECVKKEIAKLKLKITDVERIIQISDIDGCYIVDNDIHESLVDKIQYHDHSIECIDKSHILSRNIQKRINITLLSGKKELIERKHRMIFSLYLFGCNLDHVLHNNRNLNPKDKVSMAKSFALSYDGKERDFISLSQAFMTVPTNKMYLDWVKMDHHSLAKSSNIYTLFDGETYENQ